MNSPLTFRPLLGKDIAPLIPTPLTADALAVVADFEANEGIGLEPVTQLSADDVNALTAEFEKHFLACDEQDKSISLTVSIEDIPADASFFPVPLATLWIDTEDGYLSESLFEALDESYVIAHLRGGDFAVVASYPLDVTAEKLSGIGFSFTRF